LLSGDGDRAPYLQRGDDEKEIEARAVAGPRHFQAAHGDRGAVVLRADPEQMQRAGDGGPGEVGEDVPGPSQIHEQQHRTGGENRAEILPPKREGRCCCAHVPVVCGMNLGLGVFGRDLAGLAALREHRNAEEADQREGRAGGAG